MRNYQRLMIAGLIALGSIITPSKSDARGFKGVWVKSMNTPTYVDVQTMQRVHHVGTGQVYDGFYCNFNDGVYKQFDGTISTPRNKGYFLPGDLTCDPAETRHWELTIERGNFKFLEDAVKEAALTKDDKKMTNAIINDIIVADPLKYFQGQGEEGVTDKKELAKSLTENQIKKILQSYTEISKKQDNTVY